MYKKLHHFFFRFQCSGFRDSVSQARPACPDVAGPRLSEHRLATRLLSPYSNGGQVAGRPDT